MNGQSLYHTFQRYRTLGTDRITALPIVILMPHSACNCRCVMCDIWKNNQHAQQLNEEDIKGLLGALKRLGTKQVVMSGGEALLHPGFFRFCALLKKQVLSINLLSTGITLKKNADKLVTHVDDLIVSLDGDEATHDSIRRIRGAYARLKEGVQYVKSLRPDFRVASRTVIHRLNYAYWPAIIASAKQIGIDQVSFLPADVSSTAFNRASPWEAERQDEIALQPEDLSKLRSVIDYLQFANRTDFESGYIAESPEKINMILTYYQALHGLAPFPFRKCNAPWVSAVVEADGSVRPCFFHEAIGNIREEGLSQVLNGRKGMQFRKQLDMSTNETCRRCVCSLHLPPHKTI